jgi:hypothetical protein
VVVVCFVSIRVESVVWSLRHGVACLGTTPPTCAGGV